MIIRTVQIPFPFINTTLTAMLVDLGREYVYAPTIRFKILLQRPHIKLPNGVPSYKMVNSLVSFYSMDAEISMAA